MKKNEEKVQESTNNAPEIIVLNLSKNAGDGHGYPFKELLESYGKSEIDDSFWWDLTAAEIFCCGDEKYILGTVNSYRNNCMKDPVSAATFAITLNHKFWSWYGQNEVLAKMYGSLCEQFHNDILLKADKGEVSEEWFLKYYKLVD